jgi:hypothetical protein
MPRISLFLRYLTAATLFAALSSACTTKAAAPDPKEILKLQARIDSLETAMDALKLRLTWTEEAIPAKSLSLHLDDQGYAMLGTPYGSLSFQLLDLQPAGSGTKARIRIGNATAATLSDVTAEIGWMGKAPSSAGVPKPDSRLARQIDAGTWTTVDVILSDVQPSDVRTVYISDVTARSMSLAR